VFTVNSLIVETVLVSSTLVMPCPARHATLTAYAPVPQGVPVTSWPKRREQPELPHLPDEETSLVLNVGSVSGNTNSSAQLTTYTISDTQLAWLPNSLGHKVITLPVEKVGAEWSFATPSNPEPKCRLRTKPLTGRLTARARSRC
jgi:hypothetical protein